METIAASKFKATCLATLQRVHKTRKPILVTRYGKPVAEIAPPRAPAKSVRFVGRLKGTGEVVGDIVSPAYDPKDWFQE